MECPKAREADEWHRRETGKLRAALRTLANLHAQALADMELLVAGTEEYEKRLEDLDAEAWKIDYDGKRGRQRIERGRTALLRALHVRMLSVVGNLARKRGYELVATKNDGLIEMMRLETMDQFLAMVATQAVLYGDKSLDITDEVLKELLN